MWSFEGFPSMEWGPLLSPNGSGTTLHTAYTRRFGVLELFDFGERINVYSINPLDQLMLSPEDSRYFCICYFITLSWSYTTISFFISWWYQKKRQTFENVCNQGTKIYIRTGFVVYTIYAPNPNAMFPRCWLCCVCNISWDSRFGELRMYVCISEEFWFKLYFIP